MIHPEVIREAIEVLRLQGDTAMSDQVQELLDASEVKTTADQVRGAARWALGHYDPSKPDEMPLEGPAQDVLGIGLHDELMHAARAHGRVYALAEMLLAEFFDESQADDAVDVAMRLLRDHKQLREAPQLIQVPVPDEMTDEETAEFEEALSNALKRPWRAVLTDLNTIEGAVAREYDRD